MKIVQLNMWMGHLLHPALDFVSSESPDILCCQEVLSSSTYSILFDNLQLHEKLNEMFPYQYFEPTFSFEAFGADARLGNAIYSKYPIEKTSAAFTNGSYRELQRAADYVPNIRNIQKAEIVLPGHKRLSIANHHGFHDLDPLGSDQTVAAMQKAKEFLRQIDGPLIFCGDLNIKPASPAIRVLDELNLRNLTADNGLQNTLSSLSWVKSAVACDYIFVSDDIKVHNFAASDALVSDHSPLIMEFEL